MLTNVFVGLPKISPGYGIPVLTPGANGLFVSKIDGLYPVAANVATKNYGIGDGEYFGGSHRGKRNIVLTIGMESRGIDVEAARAELFGHFYSLDSLKLRFTFDDRADVEIIGYLETHESDRFVQDPETQISIICPKPNFIDPVVKTYTGTSGAAPPVTDVLYQGDRSAGFLTQVIIPTAADIEIGTITFKSAVVGEYATSSALEVFIGGYDTPFVLGEELWLDTRQGLKSIYIYNPTTLARRNALKSMTDESRWPVLHPGNNTFQVFTASTVIRDWVMTFQHEFGGV